MDRLECIFYIHAIHAFHAFWFCLRKNFSDEKISIMSRKAWKAWKHEYRTSILYSIRKNVIL